MREDQIKLAAFLLLGLLTFLAFWGFKEIPTSQGVASMPDVSHESKR